MSIALPIAMFAVGCGLIGLVIGWWCARRGEQMLAQRDYERLFGGR